MVHQPPAPRLAPSAPLARFGKHKGAPLTEVPPEYLLWMASRPTLRDPARREVRAECIRRWGVTVTGYLQLPGYLHVAAELLVGISLAVHTADGDRLEELVEKVRSLPDEVVDQAGQALLARVRHGHTPEVPADMPAAAHQAQAEADDGDPATLAELEGFGRGLPSERPDGDAHWPGGCAGDV